MEADRTGKAAFTWAEAPATARALTSPRAIGPRLRKRTEVAVSSDASCALRQETAFRRSICDTCKTGRPVQ
jgi:hypothetical protein